jgi:hypothetical protein
MTSAQFPDLAICVPAHSASPEHLARCLESAEQAAPGSATLVISPDSDRAEATLAGLDLTRWRVLPRSRETGLVANWNRCLEATDCRLVHLLHEDDFVAPSYYEAVGALHREFGEAAGLLATNATAQLEEIADRSEPRTELLTGAAAARFLLGDSGYACGSVTINRAAVPDFQAFSDRYPFSPDEEAYLRWARPGGIAVDRRALYFQRTHSDQARVGTWRQESFVETYARGRLDGAAAYGEETMEFARETTRSRIRSSAVTLAIAGDRRSATRLLNQLGETDPAARSARHRALSALIRTSAGTRMLKQRRDRMERGVAA